MSERLRLAVLLGMAVLVAGVCYTYIINAASIQEREMILAERYESIRECNAMLAKCIPCMNKMIKEPLNLTNKTMCFKPCD